MKKTLCILFMLGFVFTGNALADEHFDLFASGSAEILNIELIEFGGCLVEFDFLYVRPEGTARFILVGDANDDICEGLFLAAIANRVLWLRLAYAIEPLQIHIAQAALFEPGIF